MTGDSLAELRTRIDALASDDGDGWRITLALDSDAEPNGLVSAPIRSDA